MRRTHLFSRGILGLTMGLAGLHLALADPVGGTTAGLVTPLNGSSDDPQFIFTFTIGPDAGDGVLNTTDLGGGRFLATSGSLEITSGADIGTYSLLPGGPGATTSPSGFFIYDDVIYPTGNSGGPSTLDVDGLLFAGGGLEINIWGNAFNGTNWIYTFDSATGGSLNVNDKGVGPVTFTEAPESGAFYSLVSVVGLLGLYRRDGTRSQL